MRKTLVLHTLALLTAAPALLAVPAYARINTDGVARADPIAATNPVGEVIGGLDGTANKTVDTANLTLATREQVRAGAEIYDTNGKSIGTVQSIEGDIAVVIRGGKLYNVPIAQIYHGAVGETPALVTKLSNAEIEARTTAADE